MVYINAKVNFVTLSFYKLYDFVKKNNPSLIESFEAEAIDRKDSLKNDLTLQIKDSNFDFNMYKPFFEAAIKRQM